jgi:hypothetical protein
MNTKENISRIKEIMEIPDNDIYSKYNRVLYPIFDKIFDNLETSNTDTGGMVWKEKNVNKISFHKNWRGILFVHNCELYNKIISYSKYLAIDETDLLFLLTQYMIKKYDLTDEVLKTNISRCR